MGQGFKNNSGRLFWVFGGSNNDPAKSIEKSHIRSLLTYRRTNISTTSLHVRTSGPNGIANTVVTRPRLIGLHETAVGVRETVVVRCDQVPRDESGDGEGGKDRGSLGGVW